MLYRHQISVYTIVIAVNISGLWFVTQVKKPVQSLKHKLRPDNAYFKATDFDAILSALKEELHQLLLGQYGEHLLPATMYETEKVLRNPDTVKGYDKMRHQYT